MTAFDAQGSFANQFGSPRFRQLQLPLSPLKGLLWVVNWTVIEVRYGEKQTLGYYVESALMTVYAPYSLIPVLKLFSVPTDESHDPPRSAARACHDCTTHLFYRAETE